MHARPIGEGFFGSAKLGVSRQPASGTLVEDGGEQLKTLNTGVDICECKWFL